jgi:hypothetical protein
MQNINIVTLLMFTSLHYQTIYDEPYYKSSTIKAQLHDSMIGIIRININIMYCMINVLLYIMSTISRN